MLLNRVHDVQRKCHHHNLHANYEGTIAEYERLYYTFQPLVNEGTESSRGQVVTSLPFIVLMSVTVYMRGPTAPPSSSGGCQLTVAEKGPISLAVMARGALGGTVCALRL